MVNQLDYQFWKDHFGETVPGSGSGSSAVAGSLTVPEPSAAWLLAFGTVIGLAYSRTVRVRCSRNEPILADVWV
jgi:hypothetical protein